MVKMDCGWLANKKQCFPHSLHMKSENCHVDLQWITQVILIHSMHVLFFIDVCFDFLPEKNDKTFSLGPVVEVIE